jgi:hypothetical protein
MKVFAHKVQLLPAIKIIENKKSQDFHNENSSTPCLTTHHQSLMWTLFSIFSPQANKALHATKLPMSTTTSWELKSHFILRTQRHNLQPRLIKQKIWEKKPYIPGKQHFPRQFLPHPSNPFSEFSSW